MTDWTPSIPQDDDTGVYSYLLSLLETPDWYDRAACKGLGALMFAQGRTIDKTGNTRALAVCATCPVVAECRELALSLPYHWPGVWGGMSGKQRQKLKGAGARARKESAA